MKPHKKMLIVSEAIQKEGITSSQMKKAGNLLRHSQKHKAAALEILKASKDENRNFIAYMLTEPAAGYGKAKMLGIYPEGTQETTHRILTAWQAKLAKFFITEGILQ